jgi:hypothetical protein
MSERVPPASAVAVNAPIHGRWEVRGLASRSSSSGTPGPRTVLRSLELARSWVCQRRPNARRAAPVPGRGASRWGRPGGDPQSSTAWPESALTGPTRRACTADRAGSPTRHRRRDGQPFGGDKRAPTPRRSSTCRACWSTSKRWVSPGWVGSTTGSRPFTHAAAGCGFRIGWSAPGWSPTCCATASRQRLPGRVQRPVPRAGRGGVRRCALSEERHDCA